MVFVGKVLDYLVFVYYEFFDDHAAGFFLVYRGFFGQQLVDYLTLGRLFA